MTSSSLADFSSAFEKLDATGRNWTTFRQRFQIAVRQKEAWGHLDGTSTRPVPADEANVEPAEQVAIAAFTKHARKETATTIWAAIVQEFAQKSMLLRANLRTQFLTMRAMSGANLHTELDRLRVKYEELRSFQPSFRKSLPLRSLPVASRLCRLLHSHQMCQPRKCRLLMRKRSWRSLSKSGTVGTVASPSLSRRTQESQRV